VGVDVTEIVALPGSNRWQVGDTEFVYNARKSSARRFAIRKPADLIARYVEICKDFRHGAIVELGIFAGGSTALISLLAQPRKLVACELDEQPVPALTEFIRAHGVSDVVRPFYGVNQADRVRLAEILDAEFPGQRLDLVIDDASHRYEETKASFEVLFPRLRAAGAFVIEDWQVDHGGARLVLAAMKDRSSPHFAERERRFTDRAVARAMGVGRSPLHRLGIELLQVCADSSSVVSEITINKQWIVVRRGSAELDPLTFRIADHYAEGTWDWKSD
jgi:predicted O-methyltransferase YrrM